MARIKSLKAGLAAKAQELYSTSENEAQAAANFMAASAKAQQTSEVAARHAQAVVAASVILEEAGVEL